MRSRRSAIVSRPTLRVLIFACAFLSPDAFVHAQPVKTNPSIVSFVPSDDHYTVAADGQPVVAAYEMEFFVQGDPRVILSLALGKPVPAPDGIISVDFGRLLGWAPLPGWVLEARVAAVGPTGRGESEASNPFTFDSTWRPPSAQGARKPPPSATTIGKAKVRKK